MERPECRPSHFTICSDGLGFEDYRRIVPTYGQFCPVAKTSELLCERWMPLILRELMSGSARFGEIQRGVPLISPALLTKRLRQLTAAGVAVRTENGRDITYELTPAGWELYPIIEAMGVWGQRWARSHYGPDELDPSFLMWDMRRMLAPAGLAEQPTVIEFRIRGGPPRKTRYWLVVEDAGIDLCLVDPQRDIDLCVETTLKALTEVWMGDRTMADAVGDGSIALHGPPRLARRFPAWLGQHPVLGGVRVAVRT